MPVQTDPPSVAILSSTLSSLGGAEKVAVFLAAACRDANMAPTIWSADPVRHEMIERRYGVSADGIALRTLPGTVPDVSTGWRAGRVLQRDVQWARAMRSDNPDLFINTQYKSLISGVGTSNWNYVHFPHPLAEHRKGLLPMFVSGAIWQARKALLFRGREWAQSFDTIFANSSFTAENISRMWGTRATVLYPPCDVHARPAAPQSLSRSIVSIGRFQASGAGIPHKNHRAMIDAFRRLQSLSSDQKWTLHFIGGLNSSDNAEMTHYRALQDYADGLNIIFHPNATHEELRGTLEDASFYWHAQGYGSDTHRAPHEQEHFGITVVDAMSAGCVPLVFRSGGPQEIVAPVDETLLWESTDELAERTTSLASDPERWRDLATRSIARSADFSEESFTTMVQHALARL